MTATNPTVAEQLAYVDTRRHYALRVRELADIGMAQKEIGAELGLSRHHVKALAREAGIAINTQIYGAAEAALAEANFDWQLDAACRGHTEPDLWFSGASEDVTAALRICRGCPVQTECGTFAITTGQAYGTWGGMTAWKRSHATNQAKTKGAA